MRTEVKTLTIQAEEARRRLERAVGLKSKRAWSGFFATLGRCMPTSCWLESMITDPASPAANASRTAAAEPPKTQDAGSVQIDAPRKLKLVGFAPEAGDPHIFVGNLRNTKLFSKVTLESCQRDASLSGSYFRFELVCEW